jgi:hypothetical protein
MERGIYAQQVRSHARAEYIEPARRRGETIVRIVAGEVEKGRSSPQSGIIGMPGSAVAQIPKRERDRA